MRRCAAPQRPAGPGDRDRRLARPAPRALRRAGPRDPHARRPRSLGAAGAGRIGRGGLAAHARRPPLRQRLWFATELGVRAAQERQRSRASRGSSRAGEVAGPLQAHTVAVNEAGICFLGRPASAAMSSGRSPGATRSPIRCARGERRRRRSALRRRRPHLSAPDRRAGASSSSASSSSTGRRCRSTASRRSSPATPSSTARLGGGEAMWKQHYPLFPKVHCVLAGARSRRFERRRSSVIALMSGNPQLKGIRVPSSRSAWSKICAEGPFAPIFRCVASPSGGRLARSLAVRRRRGSAR